MFDFDNEVSTYEVEAESASEQAAPQEQSAPEAKQAAERIGKAVWADKSQAVIGNFAQFFGGMVNSTWFDKEIASLFLFYKNNDAMSGLPK